MSTQLITTLTQFLNSLDFGGSQPDKQKQLQAARHALDDIQQGLDRG